MCVVMPELYFISISYTFIVLTKYDHPSFQYTGQVYREISMENSDYGGMENVMTHLCVRVDVH